jgi:hypothetical protein
MPTAPDGDNNPLIASGTATSEGQLTLSADGRFLILTGYNSQIPGPMSLSNTTADVVNRVIGRVDAQGNIDTRTSLTRLRQREQPPRRRQQQWHRYLGDWWQRQCALHHPRLHHLDQHHHCPRQYPRH